MRNPSLKATGWGCVAALVAFAAPFAFVFFALPALLSAFIRWEGGYGENQSPEALAILVMMAASPFLTALTLAAGYVLGVLAFAIVSRWSERERADQPRPR